MQTTTYLAGNLFDTANGLVNQTQTLVNAAAVLIVVIFVIVFTCKGGFSFAKLLISGGVGALVLFLVIGGGGMLFFKDQIKDTIQPGASSVSVQVTQDAHDRV